jgi:hypothetical protein
MFITVLPKPDVNYMCAPKLNHTITFLGKIQFLLQTFTMQSPERKESGSFGVGRGRAEMG